MNPEVLETALAGLPLGPVRYFARIGSTNDEAANWAEVGAPDLAIVIADEQTAGRGRLDRKWITPPGTALAFSIVLAAPKTIATREKFSPPETISRLTALGALAVCQALHLDYGLGAQIKWPNDVLLDGRKVAGVLVEAHWQGDQIASVIMGIGINVAPGSVPPEQELIFPATSVETEFSKPIKRPELLRSVLNQLLNWHERLGEDDFLQTWEQKLAFKGEWVEVRSHSTGEGQTTLQGRILGLDHRGRLRLRDEDGNVFNLLVGEVSLRQVDTI
jgi:BirA family biotin operon repressor/biotin-[acetyl-CoA-carboxylase] ligase